MTEAVRVPSRPGRNVALDGARGVAVALVVCAHWSMTTVRYGGVVGVTIFFVLSGYLITSILLAEHAATGRINLRAFYTRRALRLFPALALLIVALPFLQKAVGDPRLTYGYIRWAATSVFYLGDFVRASGATLGPLNHTWSLAVEEQFYLVWPLALLALLWWARGDARKLLRGVAVLAALATAWTAVAVFILPFARTYFAPDTNAFALMAGCALAAWLKASPPRPSRRVWPTWVALAVLVGMAMFPSIDVYGIDLRIAAHGAPIAGAAAIALILAAVSCPDRGPLLWKPLTWLGTVSYGVYLWHAALVEFLPWGTPLVGRYRLAAILVSVGIAALSYYLLERPLLRLKRRFEFRSPAVPAVAEVVAPAPAGPELVGAVPAPRLVPATRVPHTRSALALRAGREETASRGVVSAATGP